MTVTRLPCPGCGETARDRGDRALGYCPRCGEFTGRCAVGWLPLLPPAGGLIAPGPWHLPCSAAGAVPCAVTVPGRPAAKRRLCRAHAALVAAGRSPWPPEHLTLDGADPDAMRAGVAARIASEHPGWTVTHGERGLLAVRPGREAVRSLTPAGLRVQLGGQP